MAGCFSPWLQECEPNCHVYHDCAWREKTGYCIGPVDCGQLHEKPVVLGVMGKLFRGQM